MARVRVCHQALVAADEPDRTAQVAVRVEHAGPHAAHVEPADRRAVAMAARVEHAGPRAAAAAARAERAGRRAVVVAADLAREDRLAVAAVVALAAFVRDGRAADCDGSKLAFSSICTGTGVTVNCWWWVKGWFAVPGFQCTARSLANSWCWPDR